MATRQTRLYYNTGFNTGNTPGNTSILNNASYLDLEAHWDYQDFFLNSLKIKATWDQVKNADYLKYGEAYYWVTGISMLNTNTAEMYLQLDALASMGGAKSLTYTSGILKRAHPLTDNSFENTLAEPISPQRALKLMGTSSAGPSNCDCNVFTLSTLAFADNIDIDDKGNVVPHNPSATKYAVAGQDAGEVIVPNSPKGASGCQVGDTFISGVNYYVSFNDSTGQKVGNQIAYLRSLGLEQAIVGNYAVPKFWSDGKWSGHASVNTLPARATQINKITSTTVNGPQYNPVGTTWKKTQELNNSYVVMSKLTGETKVYKTKDIIGGSNYPAFAMCADINIHGKPYIWPARFRGADTSGFINSNGLSGMQWLDLPIIATGASGSLWIGNQYTRDTATVARDTVEMGANAVKGVVRNLGLPSVGQMADARFNQQDLSQAFNGYQGPNLGGLVDTVQNTAFTASKLQYRAEKIDTDFKQNTEFVVPSMSGALADGLQTSIPNGFYIYHFMMDPADLNKFDNFFTKYGYAQDCIFDKQYMTDHWGLGYVYIQTEDIHIGRTGAAANVGIGVKNLAESALNGGIRIWDRLPG